MQSIPKVLVVVMIAASSLTNTRCAMPDEQPSITIVTLGDSTTAPRKVGSSLSGRSDGPTTRGENAEDPQNNIRNIVNKDEHQSAWLYVYSDILRDELPTRGVIVAAVDNEGIGGARTDEALARLKVDVESKKPNWVIVQFGINDSWWDSSRPADLQRPDSSGSRVALNAHEQSGGDNVFGNGNDHIHADRGNYQDNLTQIVRKLQGDHVRVILMTPNQLSYRGDDLWRNQLLASYAQAVREVAQAEGALLVDVWQIYEDYASKQARSVSDLLLDCEHPNATGHRLVANALMAEMTRTESNQATSRRK